MLYRRCNLSRIPIFMGYTPFLGPDTMTTVNIPLLRLGSRSVLWFVLAFGLLFLVRVPFLLIHYVPYHLPFEPWVALIPLLGVLWGAPAVLAVGVATGLGDWMGGIRGVLPVCHTVGMMTWAWSARTLWYARVTRDAAMEPPSVSVTWSAAFYFLVISLPGAVAASAWTALGADIGRNYPYSYAAFITICNHLFFLLIFGVVLYRACEREIVPRFGCWDQFATTHRHPSSLGLILQVAGAAGAWGIGYIVSVRLGYPARGPAVMGDTAGLRLLPGVIPFLILFTIGLLCPGKRRVNVLSVTSDQRD